MKSRMPLEIPDKSHLITIIDEADKSKELLSGCREFGYIMPNLLSSKALREFDAAKKKYLEEHPDKPLKYDFRTIDDVFAIPGFDIDKFIVAFKDTAKGIKIKDVSSFDEPKIIRRYRDLDFDSLCFVLKDKTVTIKGRNYLILETQCFDEDGCGRVDGCYSTIVVGELTYFRREKENSVENVIAIAELVDKEQLSALFEYARKCNFKGYVGFWDIPIGEIISVEYSKLVVKG